MQFPHPLLLIYTATWNLRKVSQNTYKINQVHSYTFSFPCTFSDSNFLINNSKICSLLSYDPLLHGLLTSFLGTLLSTDFQEDLLQSLHLYLLEPCHLDQGWSLELSLQVQQFMQPCTVPNVNKIRLELVCFVDLFSEQAIKYWEIVTSIQASIDLALYLLHNGLLSYHAYMDILSI